MWMQPGTLNTNVWDEHTSSCSAVWRPDERGFPGVHHEAWRRASRDPHDCYLQSIGSSADHPRFGRADWCSKRFGPLIVHHYSVFFQNKLNSTTFYFIFSTGCQGTDKEDNISENRFQVLFSGLLAELREIASAGPDFDFIAKLAAVAGEFSKTWNPFCLSYIRRSDVLQRWFGSFHCVCGSQ